MKYLPLDTVGTGHTGYQQQVKEANIKRIFDLVRSEKCKSRAEIVRYMNLSATSVSVLVEELNARGLIDEIGPAQTSLPGRRPISLRLNADAHQMAIFSLQRGRVRYTLLNLECRILESDTFPIELDAQPDADAGEAYCGLFEDILLRRSKLFDHSRALVIGISFPGIFTPSDGMFHAESTMGVVLSEAALYRFQQRVALPIYLSNTTRSMAYAEKKFLDAENPEGPETRDMLFVEIRDGIGCAILTGGNIYEGPYNVAGEIGHTTIDYQGRPCPCGNMGCLSRYVNLRAILEDAQRACEAAGVEAPESFEALAARYTGEPVLLESVRQSARLLAFGLYTVMCTSGLRRIVLGGGIEQLGKPFLEELYRALHARSLLIRHLELDYARSGPDAESIGIAQHYLDKAFRITG